MHQPVKTDYSQDLRLFRTAGQVWSYAALAVFLLAAPILFGNYLLSQVVFVIIYAIVGIALIILSGYTGQVSIGHAAFLAIGAYTAAYCQKQGIPFVVYFVLAGALTGVVGYLVGLPALRLHGVYLAIATFAFAFIVEEILARWESVTNGNEGIMLALPDLFGLKLGDTGFYYLCLAVVTTIMLGAINLLRSPTGRAFVALRDSETAAKSMGVNPARYKTRSFAISAAITGLAGVLYAHKLSFISPEMFTLSLSIEFIMIVIIGGIASLRGAVFGAIFMIMVDPVLATLKDDLPGLVANVVSVLGLNGGGAQEAVARVVNAPGLKSLIFGLIIIFFIIFEPFGLAGRWEKIKLYVRLFPLYKATTFKRQKMYLKSERGR
ncbi:branched-chain amino acid ABC transporter permease [Chelatococcus reniformis]|uniref:Branched-chain amino acid ABC transporter permease n=1 Tax=Chelatococcus reniformis TaxID=1494448 RepID=A0A916TY52_9HYPH|nr:branched-chain amino acid ABC transporter permease [Chelatococcus reniformis]GGC47461.1 branched-chain amino acid ABC transporter permease [Chelatococcus reniformis]